MELKDNKVFLTSTEQIDLDVAADSVDAARIGRLWWLATERVRRQQEELGPMTPPVYIYATHMTPGARVYGPGDPERIAASRQSERLRDMAHAALAISMETLSPNGL
jgi:hypothetical protein